jgi:hypothetical protein
MAAAESVVADGGVGAPAVGPVSITLLGKGTWDLVVPQLYHLKVADLDTLFINGRMVSGAQPFAVFEAVIEEALEE